MSRSLRLGLVSPRFEPVTAVGSEVQIRQFARRLSARGHRVEVLTTCIRDFMTWKNHYSPGLTDEEGYGVRRFPADPGRGRRRALEIGRRLERGEIPGTEEQEAWLRSLGASSAMAGFLAGQGSRYDAFIVGPALSGAVFGAPPEVLRRSLLLAALPDSAEARLPVLRERYQSLSCALAGSGAESDLLQEAFGLPGERILAAGAAVDPAPCDPEAFRGRHGIEVPFLFFAGRRLPSKGVDRLIEYASVLAASGGIDFRLVLAGENDIDVPERARDLVIDLHFIEEQDKYDGLAAALAFCQPSPREGLALAPMESWLAGRPVLADAGGTVTVERCRRSGGGLWYGSYFEFEECVRLLLDDSERAAAMGRQGSDFVRRHWSWEKNITAIEEACSAVAG